MSKKSIKFALIFVIFIICGAALFGSYFTSTSPQVKFIAPRQQQQYGAETVLHQSDNLTDFAGGSKRQESELDSSMRIHTQGDSSRLPLVKQFFPRVIEIFSHPLLPDYKEPCFKSRKKIQCLPYFYLVSPPKCATTDFWFNLQRHPQIVTARGGDSKEPHFWGNANKTDDKVLTKYLWRHRGVVAKAKSPYLKSRLITGDGSCSTLWHNGGIISRSRHEHRSQEVPFIWADVIHAITPGVKLITILRNPIDRTISDYYAFFGTRKKRRKIMGPEHFHTNLVRVIGEMDDCLHHQNKTLLICASRISGHPRIHISMYITFLREWLRVFPREQFFILTTEDWVHRTDPDILPKIHKFLEIDPMSEDQLSAIGTQSQSLISAKAKSRQIFPESRALMHKFFEPFNQQLAAYLGDDRFLWK